MKLEQLVKEFFEILGTVEESDSGKEFHPVFISSCRVMKTKRLGEIFKEMKNIIGYKEDEKRRCRIMNKICNDGSLLNSCEHKAIGNGCFYCNYFGYCDFQRPRDSRNWTYSFYSSEEIKDNNYGTK